VIPSVEYPDGTRESPPDAHSKNLIVEQKEVLEGALKMTSEQELSKVQTASPRCRRPTIDSGALNKGLTDSPGKHEVKAGNRTLRPSTSRLFSGIIGEAKNKFTKP
jgi:hypothetical protein